MQRSSKGFKQKRSTYRISAAPSGRGRCRRCRKFIAKGETRLEVCAFVRPGRYTLLLCCTEAVCINAPLSAAVLSVYKHADRVPIERLLCCLRRSPRARLRASPHGIDLRAGHFPWHCGPRGTLSGPPGLRVVHFLPIRPHCRTRLLRLGGAVSPRGKGSCPVFSNWSPA